MRHFPYKVSEIQIQRNLKGNKRYHWQICFCHSAPRLDGEPASAVLDVALDDAAPADVDGGGGRGGRGVGVSA